MSFALPFHTFKRWLCSFVSLVLHCFSFLDSLEHSLFWHASDVSVYQVPKTKTATIREDFAGCWIRQMKIQMQMQMYVSFNLVVFTI